MKDDVLSVGSDYFSESINRIPLKALYVNKVMNDLNVFCDVEIGVSLFLQVIGHCRYRITLVDGKSNHRRIGLVFSNKRNICTVQGCDERNLNTFGGEDLSGHICCRRMWNGIMNME